MKFYIATVQKLINEILPSDLVCTKETRDLMIECCVEFIHLLASESNEVCEKDNKKTIAAEHVIGALQTLGFESYVPGVQEVLEEHRVNLKSREKKYSTLETSGLSYEQLQRDQELLFAKARERLHNNPQP